MILNEITQKESRVALSSRNVFLNTYIILNSEVKKKKKKETMTLNKLKRNS